MRKFSELRNNSRKNLMDMIPLKKPLAVTIDPCSICNFRCSQCLQSDLSTTICKRMMTFSEFKKVVDDFSAWGGEKLKVVKLYNCGEPLLNPEFIQMLQYLHETDIAERVDLTSNGTMLTEDISDKLIDYGLDYLRFSIYSPLQEKNEQITNSKINVDTIYNNIYRLSQMRLEKCSRKPYIAVKMFETDDEKEKNFFIEKYQGIADEVFFEKKHDFSGRGKEVIECMGTEKAVCPWPFYALTIQSDGTVDCCCVDWENKTKVGNAFDESIEQIWNGDRLKAFCINQLERNRKQMDACKNCSLYLTDLFTIDNIDDLSADEYRRRKEL